MHGSSPFSAYNTEPNIVREFSQLCAMHDIMYHKANSDFDLRPLQVVT